MALSSQSGRPMSRNNYMSSRRRSRRGRLLLLLALVACAVLIGVWVFDTETTTEDDKAKTTGTLASAADDNKSTSVSPRIIDTTSDLVKAPKEPDDTGGPIELNHGTTIPKPVTNTPEAATPTPRKPFRRAPDLGNTTASRDLQNALNLADTEPVQARRLMTQAWRSGRLTDNERAQATELAKRLTEIVLFDPRILDGDPFSRRYTVQNGDALERIVRNEGVNTEWAFVARINGLRNANAIQVGQTIKLPAGTFHAEVSKPDYRLDLYQDYNNERVLVASFTVGLGEFGSTPNGTFRIRPDSKLVNPEWIDPRTREHFGQNDPENPIGERWIGIEGLEEHNRGLRGFGIHGTIEPDSIGKQRSMGCIRMLPDDVAVVYEVLTEPKSTIEILGDDPFDREPNSP